MVKLSDEQERVTSLLTDTVALLCRNGLQFKNEMKVQGLLGITLDNEVFIVQIDKQFGDLTSNQVTSVQSAEEDVCDNSSEDSLSDSTENSHVSKRRRKRRRSREFHQHDQSTPQAVGASPTGPVIVKREPKQDEEEDEDDDILLVGADVKSELHDKDTMRESYGVPADPLLKRLKNDTYNSSMDMSDQQGNNPGCSSWDDSLTGISGIAGDDGSGMDQQTMSTWTSRPYNYRPDADKHPYVYVCKEVGCKKNFNYKQNLQRHQTLKHGRLPSKKWDPIASSYNPWEHQPSNSSSNTPPRFTDVHQQNPNNTIYNTQHSPVSATSGINYTRNDAHDRFPADTHFQKSWTEQSEYGSTTPNFREYRDASRKTGDSGKCEYIEDGARNDSDGQIKKKEVFVIVPEDEDGDDSNM